MKLTKIGDFLKRSKIPIDILDNEEYKRVTIRINHNGVSLRDTEIGKKIGTKKQFILKSGQFIVSKIDARYGAFGIAPNEVNDAIITGNFWAYDVDFSKLNIEWFNQFTNSPDFYDLCERASAGITHRKYLNESFFLNYEIMLPSVEEQLIQIDKIKLQKISFGELTSELSHQLDLIKKLRHAFLREAMQGKLVNRTNLTETGQQLLEKIKAEKAQLIANKKLKKEKELPPISEYEIPFEIPEHWVWCRLGDSLELLTDYHANGGYENLKANVELLENENFAIMLRTTNFHPNKYFDYKYITKEAYHFLEKSKVFPGDLIMNKIGDPGVVFFVDERGKPMSLAMNLFLLRFSKNVSNFYMYSYLDMQKNHIKSFAKGSTSMTITKDAVKELVVPIPPLHEQEQIVAKLEELMAFCDGLEQSIKESQGYNEKLLQQVLREALQGKEEVNN